MSHVRLFTSFNVRARKRSYLAWVSVSSILYLFRKKFAISLWTRPTSSIRPLFIQIVLLIGQTWLQWPLVFSFEQSVNPSLILISDLLKFFYQNFMSEIVWIFLYFLLHLKMLTSTANSRPNPFAFFSLSYY